ncbi:nuclease-related domain-containing protein [Salsuginibacillus kocurii]|uniref:nuclease-related domain-containing protein n=1 Tax=Salsuginibacillus kocurii TaxID=427078 RepID=UPI0003767ECD|nr:nuclease-related domain-containing protein [Salsuginibacillus kocurii]
MAHLIKLQDYVSRYEIDMKRYPSQFTRLKKERWRQLERAWRQANSYSYQHEGESNEWFEEAEQGFIYQTIDRIKQFYGKRRQTVELQEEEDIYERLAGMSFDEVKARFKKELVRSQIKWASSSLSEESKVHPAYYYDNHLFYFLNQLPDNYMIMYNPSLETRRATVDLDILLIGPNEILCIVPVDGQETSVIEASSDRFWKEYVSGGQKKILSPLLALNRLETVTHDLLTPYQLDLSFERIVFAPDVLIDNRGRGMNVKMVDKRNCEAWMDKLKRQPSPLKTGQLKAAQVLLDHAVTTSFLRDTVERDAEL